MEYWEKKERFPVYQLQGRSVSVVNATLLELDAAVPACHWSPTLAVSP